MKMSAKYKSSAWTLEHWGWRSELQGLKKPVTLPLAGSKSTPPPQSFTDFHRKEQQARAVAARSKQLPARKSRKGPTTTTANQPDHIAAGQGQFFATVS